MAIVNLSGNFQPPMAEGGKNLPQPSSRAPSTKTIGSAANETHQLGVAAKSDTLQATDALVISSEKIIERKPQIESQIEQLQQFNQSINRSLLFEVDEELGITVVRVVDKDTDELIRQFPPEELLNLSRRLKELIEEDFASTGVLLQEKV